MKTLHWVLLALSGWLTLAALVETIEGYAFLDTFRLRVILAVSFVAICTVGAAKIISIGRQKQLPVRFYLVGIACFFATVGARSLAPSAQASVLIALTLSSVPYLILGLRASFRRPSSAGRVTGLDVLNRSVTRPRSAWKVTSTATRLEYVPDSSFVVDRAA